MTRLKSERLKRGWSLQALGFHAGIQGAEISKIERRILQPYPKQLERLAQVLELTASQVLEEVTHEERKRVAI
jgi:transcriptional regulator with XRE-family HTH domain